MARLLVLMQEDSELWPRALWEASLDRVPRALHAEILRFQWPEDRQQRLAARLLLSEGLRCLGLDHSLEGWRRDGMGRPFLAPTAKVSRPPDFSCSHARGLTAVALGLDCRVGVDVEAVRPLPRESLARILTSAEKDYVENNADPQCLIQLWTRKEALLKGEGRALTANPQWAEVLEPEVALGGHVWRIWRVETLAGYVCHVVSSASMIHAPEVRLLPPLCAMA